MTRCEVWAYTKMKTYHVSSSALTYSSEQNICKQTGAIFAERAYCIHWLLPSERLPFIDAFNKERRLWIELMLLQLLNTLSISLQMILKLIHLANLFCFWSFSWPNKMKRSHRIVTVTVWCNFQMQFQSDIGLQWCKYYCISQINIQAYIQSI